MKKVTKALITVGAMALSFSVMNRPVYAYNDITANLGDTATISSEVLKANGLDFDYTTYSKETIEGLINYLESVHNENDSLQYEYFEFEVKLAYEKNTFKEGKLIHPLYVLQDRLEYAINGSGNALYKEQSKTLLKVVTEDINAYESRMKIQNFIKSKEELAKFRQDQILWSDYFLSMFDPEFDWSKKNFSVDSINIYDFFSDGQYCAPVKNQSLGLIST